MARWQGSPYHRARFRRTLGGRTSCIPRSEPGGHSSPPTILSAWPAITLVDDNEVTIGCINRQPEQSFAVVIALAFIMLRTDNKEPQLLHDARASDAGGTPNGSILKVAIYTHPHKQNFSGFTRSWRQNRGTATM